MGQGSVVVRGCPGFGEARSEGIAQLMGGRRLQCVYRVPRQLPVAPASAVCGRQAQVKGWRVWCRLVQRVDHPATVFLTRPLWCLAPRHVDGSLRQSPSCC